jgi:hypothetical protein
MTQPVEDIEKLARELAEALESSMWCYSTRPGHIAIHRDHAENEMLVILRTHCAARDAELQRLREAATAAGAYLTVSTDKTDHEVAAYLRAALFPNHQEPNDGSS